MHLDVNKFNFRLLANFCGALERLLLLQLPLPYTISGLLYSNCFRMETPLPNAI